MLQDINRFTPADVRLLIYKEVFAALTQKGPGCWFWLGRLDRYGYGIFSARIDGRRYQRAHRFAWWLKTGEHPDEAMVLHHCDQPSCVRPKDLFLGDAAINNADMLAKGRQRYLSGEDHWMRHHPERIARGHRRPIGSIPKGESHGCAKLSEIQVLEIRARWLLREVTQRELAREYHVSASTINLICLGKTWKETVCS